MTVLRRAPRGLVLCILALFLVIACQQPGSSAGPNGSVPLGATAVTLLVEPDEGAQPVVRFVDDASKTLDVAMYLLSDRDVVSAIESAERRGVKVRVMLEEHPYGEGAGNASVSKQLQTSNVVVRWSPAGFQLSHDKYAVADSKVALVGTANWTHSAFVGNREYLLIDTDPTDVAQLAGLFEADWNHQPASVTDERLVVSPTSSRRDFATLIESAQHLIDLEAEEMQDPAIETLLGAAAQRGVAVRVILPSPTSGADSNATGRSRLAAAGAKVKVLTHPYVHAKDIIVDGNEAFVGSENISTASLDSNREVGLLVSDNPSIQRLEATFGTDWNAAR